MCQKIVIFFRISLLEYAGSYTCRDEGTKTEMVSPSIKYSSTIRAKNCLEAPCLSLELKEERWLTNDSFLVEETVLFLHCPRVVYPLLHVVVVPCTLATW